MRADPGRWEKRTVAARRHEKCGRYQTVSRLARLFKQQTIGLPHTPLLTLFPLPLRRSEQSVTG